MKKQLLLTLDNIANAENFLTAWQEFLRGKRNRKDAQRFALHLIDNLFSLRDDLLRGTYRHGGYHAFGISDPKSRKIHKASVRDRVLHHAVYRVLYPLFDATFIADSFSCRVGKGTHRAFKRFASFARKASKNHTKTCWVLKCDIRKFFENIDHEILKSMLASRLPDKAVNALLGEVIESFQSHTPGKGLPLGNLTSQLMVNIYMNEFDHFAKHELKAKWYIRYADDFVFLSPDRAWLEGLIPKIKAFLRDKLRLELHPDKVFIKTFASGVDFLGWVHFPDYRVLRTATRKRMTRRVKEHPTEGTIGSYLGLLSHGNAETLRREIIPKPNAGRDYSAKRERETKGARGVRNMGFSFESMFMRVSIACTRL